jgi:hypothetical protein
LSAFIKKQHKFGRVKEGRICGLSTYCSTARQRYAMPERRGADCCAADASAEAVEDEDEKGLV